MRINREAGLGLTNIEWYNGIIRPAFHCEPLMGATQRNCSFTRWEFPVIEWPQNNPMPGQLKHSQGFGLQDFLMVLSPGLSVCRFFLSRCSVALGALVWVGSWGSLVSVVGYVFSLMKRGLEECGDIVFELL